MQTQAPDQKQIVDILFAVVVFLQTDYRPIKFDARWKRYTNTANWVL